MLSKRNYGTAAEDAFIKSHGSKVWPDKRYEIRKKGGYTLYRPNLNEARKFVKEHKAELGKVSDWEKSLFDSLFSIPVPKQKLSIFSAPEHVTRDVVIEVNGTEFTVPAGSKVRIR